VLVEPGESRDSEEVVFLFMPWRAAGLAKSQWIGDVLGRSDRRPIFGFCCWYGQNRGGVMNEKKIKALAEAAAKYRDEVPWQVIQIDECWQKGRHDWRGNEHFGSGMKWTADNLKKAGVTPGVWMCPINADSRRIVDGKVVEFSFKGEVVRVFPEQWYDGFVEGRPGKGKLDPTHPEVQAFIRKEIGRLYEYGYRYFKFDFTRVPYGYKRRYDPKKTRFQAQRDLFKLYRECVGPDSYIVACGVKPGRFVTGYADAVRIGTDTGMGGGFARELASDGNPGHIHGFWVPVHTIVTYSNENEALIVSDPDVTYSRAGGKACPIEQLRTWHSFVGLNGGSALTTTWLQFPDEHTEDSLRMLAMLNPVCPEKGWAFAGGTDPYGKEFGFIAKRPWGNFASIILWNPDHYNPADLTMKNVPLEDIGQKFHLWSFWDEQYLGINDNSFTVKDVPKYENKTLRLTPLGKKGEPTLVGSNLHISMGAAELKNVKTGKNGITVELIPDAGVIKGKLFIYSTKKLQLKKALGCKASVQKQGDNIFVVVVTDRQRGKIQSIRLATSK